MDDILRTLNPKISALPDITFSKVFQDSAPRGLRASPGSQGVAGDAKSDRTRRYALQRAAAGTSHPRILDRCDIGFAMFFAIAAPESSRKFPAIAGDHFAWFG